MLSIHAVSPLFFSFVVVEVDDDNTGKRNCLTESFCCWTDCINAIFNICNFAVTNVLFDGFAVGNKFDDILLQKKKKKKKWGKDAF